MNNFFTKIYIIFENKNKNKNKINQNNHKEEIQTNQTDTP